MKIATLIAILFTVAFHALAAPTVRNENNNGIAFSAVAATFAAPAQFEATVNSNVTTTDSVEPRSETKVLAYYHLCTDINYKRCANHPIIDGLFNQCDTTSGQSSIGMPGPGFYCTLWSSGNCRDGDFWVTVVSIPDFRTIGWNDRAHSIICGQFP